MAVSSEYRAYVLDRLSMVLPVRIKNMFGGAGVYTEEMFFAVIDDDMLYFKTDESNREDYLKRGMAQFMNMPYYAVPQDVLDDPETFRVWADKAVQVAAKPKRNKKAKPKGQTRP